MGSRSRCAAARPRTRSRGRSASTPSWSRSAAGPTATRSAPTPPASRSRSAASSRSTASSAPTSSTSSRSATWSRDRCWRTRRRTRARSRPKSAAGEKSAFDVVAVPAVAYTDPEIAWVGLTEEQAAREGRKVETGTFPWLASARSLGLGRSDGMTKLIFDPESRRLLGAGIVGPRAGDLIAEATLALEMGCDADDLALTIHPHPDAVGDRDVRRRGVRRHDHRSLPAQEDSRGVDGKSTESRLTEVDREVVDRVVLARRASSDGRDPVERGRLRQELARPVRLGDVGHRAAERGARRARARHRLRRRQGDDRAGAARAARQRGRRRQLAGDDRAGEEILG